MQLFDNQDFMNEVSIDCVIFGYEKRQLKVLISKLNFSGAFYALPSGFIFREEDVEAAARRILFERTGLQNVYLEEFNVFGKAIRGRKEFLDRLIALNYPDTESEKINHPIYKWFTNRFISIGYYALVNLKLVKPKITRIDASIDWYNIHELPELIMDNHQMVEKAYWRLKKDIDVKFNAFNLLPERFTMKDVQEIYETIFERKFVRTNFQRKILSMEVLERLEKKFTGAKNRAPYLYRLK